MSIIFTEWSEEAKDDIPSGHVSMPSSDENIYGEAVACVNLYEGDGSCHLCGEMTATGIWRGPNSVQVCFRCARSALPALIADALVGYNHRRTSSDDARRHHASAGIRSHEFLRDVESAYWRAFALAMEHASDRCNKEAIYGHTPAEVPADDDEPAPDSAADGQAAAEEWAKANDVPGLPPFEDPASGTVFLAQSLDVLRRYLLKSLKESEEPVFMGTLDEKSLSIVIAAKLGPRDRHTEAMFEFLACAGATVRDLPQRELQRMIRIMRNWKRAEAKAK